MLMINAYHVRLTFYQKSQESYSSTSHFLYFQRRYLGFKSSLPVVTIKFYKLMNNQKPNMDYNFF